jgi:hypothetical protein
LGTGGSVFGKVNPTHAKPKSARTNSAAAQRNENKGRLIQLRQAI